VGAVSGQKETPPILTGATPGIGGGFGVVHDPISRLKAMTTRFHGPPFTSKKDGDADRTGPEPFHKGTRATSGLPSLLYRALLPPGTTLIPRFRSPQAPQSPKTREPTHPPTRGLRTTDAPSRPLPTVAADSRIRWETTVSHITSPARARSTVRYHHGVDWRARLRKLVNREGHLGPVRLTLLRVIDPVEWYMRRNDQAEEPRPRRRAPNAVGWTAYAPLSWSTSQSAEAALGAARSERRPEEPERGVEDYQKRLHAFRQEHATLLEEKARELLRGKQTAIEASAGTVHGKLVRFRNGAVLEQWHTSPQGSGHGMMRVERRNLNDLVPLIVDYLARTVVGLGTHARPLQ
jgi:hypothetical protein